MTEGSRYSTDAFRVWVMVPSGGDDWVVSAGVPQWTETKRLVPNAFNRALGSKGSAEFQLTRATYIDDEGQAHTDTTSYAPGMYVCIARGSNAAPELAADWYGQIETIDETLMADGADGVGTVRAREIGYALYDIALDGWRRQAGDDTTGVAMARPPTANVSFTGDQIWGNAALTTGADAYMFADSTSDFGQTADELWTPLRLLTHAVAYCLPSGVPTLTLSDETSAAIEGVTDEVWDVYGLSFGQLLDLTVQRSRGFDWKVLPVGAEWVIRIYATNDDVATATDITLGNWCAGMQLQSSRQYDQVVVRGQPIVWCGTVSIDSGSLAKGWTQAQEDAFLTASGAADEDEANKFRKQDIYKDVWQKFELLPESQYQYLQANVGTGTGTTLDEFVRTVSWNGTAASIDATEIGPDIPSARLLNWTPLPNDYGQTGWDTNPKAAFRPPKVYALIDSGTGTYADVTVPQTIDDKPTATPQISVDDRSCAIRISYPYPEQLSYTNATTIGQPSSGSTGYSAVDNEIQAGRDRGYVASTMHVTVAVESAQRVEVSATRPGVTNPRKVLAVERKDLACWVLRAGTRYGTASGDRVASDTILRADHDKAQQLVDQLSAWAFQDRSAASITFFGAENAPWATIGNLIGVVTYGDSGALTRTLNTVVTSVSCDCRTGRWTVSTDYPQIPAAGGGFVSGSVRPSLSAPPDVAIERQRAKADAIERQAQSRIIVPASPSAVADTGGLSLPVAQSSHGFSVGDAIRWTGSVFAKSQADTYSNARVDGIVSSVADANNFTYVIAGGTIAGSFSANTFYYLSASTAGSATTSSSQTVSVQLYYATSTTSAVVTIGATRFGTDSAQNTYAVSADEVGSVSSSGIPYTSLSSADKRLDACISATHTVGATGRLVRVNLRGLWSSSGIQSISDLSVYLASGASYVLNAVYQAYSLSPVPISGTTTIATYGASSYTLRVSTFGGDLVILLYYSTSSLAGTGGGMLSQPVAAVNINA